MRKELFNKAYHALAILAADEIIKDKRRLLKNNMFTYYTANELTEFIEKAKLAKKWHLAEINRNEYITIKSIRALAEAKKEVDNYRDLYNIIFCYLHNSILAHIRNEDTKAVYEQHKKIADKIIAKYLDSEVKKCY